MNTNVAPTDVTRMSHTDDPHTSHEAAERTAKSTKKALLYGAVLDMLRYAELTPSEATVVYRLERHGAAWLPDADLYDVRRRMSELQQDGRIEPIQVGTQRNGRPQYMVREGQRVMRLTASEKAA